MVVLLGGAIQLGRDWRYCWTVWGKPRLWVWLLLGFLAVTAVVVMVMQRPRPSYLFALGIGLMATTGVCVWALARGFRLEGAAERWLPFAVVGLLVLVPSYENRKGPAPRPLLEAYRRLASLRPQINLTGRTIVVSGYPYELCSYLQLGKGCLDYYALRMEVLKGASWPAVLERHRAGVLYLSEHAVGDEAARALVDGSPVWGWEILATGRSPQGPWFVLRRAMGSALGRGTTTRMRSQGTAWRTGGETRRITPLMAEKSVTGFWQGRRVVVTGGAGFLGSYVVARLRDAGCDEVFVPRSRDYDLVDGGAVRRLLDDASPHV